jgi:hypothetical protein
MISFAEFMAGNIKGENPSGSTEELSIKESLMKIVEAASAETSVINEHKNTEPVEEAVIVEDNGYKLYRDKSEAFICDMEISGANPSNSKARIIIECQDLTYMFEGTIDATGKCKIPLRKMSFLEENQRGIIKLEVIAEDTIFTPWEDNFVAVSSKKVAVKVIESKDNSSAPNVRISNIR